MFTKKKTFHLERANAENGEATRNSIFKGLFLGLLSGTSFSIVSVIVKEVSNLHPGQLSLYRFILMLFMSMPQTVKSGQNPFGQRESRWLLILMGFFGSTATFLSFLAFRYLSLSVASSIVFSAPMFTTVFARILLNEPCDIFQSLTVLITVIGIIFVSKLPSQLTENPFMYSIETIYGLLSAIFAAVSFAVGMVTVRKIKSVPESIVTFNLGWFGILEGLVLTAVLGNFRWHYCGAQSVYILLLGFFSYAGQKLLVIALQSEFAGPVSTMRAAADIILSFLWQIIIFRDSPDSFGVIGAVLILLSISSVNLSKWLSHQPHDSKLRKMFEWITA